MSESDQKVQPQTNPAETQQQRWLKYGGNVLVTSVVVIALACGATWLVEKKWNQPYDTTIGGEQSLRPQTVSFLQTISKPIKITALYPKPQSDSKEQDFYTPVSDLLTDYASRNSNITVEMLDPDANQEKLSELVSSVTTRYGGPVKPYQDFVADSVKTGGVLDQIEAYSKGESGLLTPLTRSLPQDTDVQAKIVGTLNDDGAAISSLEGVSHLIREHVNTDLRAEVPGYNTDVDSINQMLSATNQNLQAWGSDLAGISAVPDLSKDLMTYLIAAQKRAKELGATVDAMSARAKGLGELKELTDIKAGLQTKSILVTSDSGYRIIPFADIWHKPQSTGLSTTSADDTRLRFYGEPQVTAALAALSDAHPPMVVFVHAGGDPLAVGGDRDRMPYAALASRLREYNLDVEEKDISADQTSDQPSTGPSEEDLKKAVWVVVEIPSQNPMVPELGTLESKLNDHLEQDKGSALVLLGPDPKDPAQPKSTELSINDVLASWGIDAGTNYCVVHAQNPPEERASGDEFNSYARKLQSVFMLSEYGTHPIVRNLNGLDLFMFLSCPIAKVEPAPSGVTVESIVPVPPSPSSWASGIAGGYLSAINYQANFTAKADYDSGHWYGDVENTADHPLYFGAVAEKVDHGRLVVLGSTEFPANNWMLMTRDDSSGVLRFPGNGELITNSILWLAHKDDMLAISSRALEVPRVRPISNRTLIVVRLLLLTAGLPLMVIAAGLVVFWRRMD